MNLIVFSPFKEILFFILALNNGRTKTLDLRLIGNKKKVVFNKILYCLQTNDIFDFYKLLVQRILIILSGKYIVIN